MGNIFLLRGRPGMFNWYGWATQDVRHIFHKNLFMFEKVHGVSTRNLSVGAGEVRLLLEGEPRRVRRLCRDLIHHVNRQLQHNSIGINIFSGGLALERLSPIKKN